MNGSEDVINYVCGPEVIEIHFLEEGAVVLCQILFKDVKVSSKQGGYTPIAVI